MDRKQVLCSKAYVAFWQELIQFVPRAREVLTKSAAVLSADELRLLGVRFHAIKGGAGFLGFNEIAAVASQLEEFLIKADLTTQVRQEKSLALLPQFEKQVALLEVPISKDERK